jgi:hypothetical protein
MQDREERRLMRQRGAGPREMKNATFNFNFGAAPLPARRSSRKTPSRELTARLSSRKTPNQLPQRQSARKTPGAGSAKGSASRRRDQRSASVATSAASGASETTGKSVAQTFKTPTVSGKRKRGQQLAVVEEMELDELEPNDSDLDESRGHSIRKSIEGPFSVVKTHSVTLNDVRENDELSPELLSRERDAAPTPTTSTVYQTPSIPKPKGKGKVDPNRRVSQKSYVRGRSRTRKSITAASASFVEQNEVVSDDELSPRHGTTSGGVTELSTGRVQDSTSGLAADTTSLFVPNNQSTRRDVFEAEDGTEEDLDDELTPPQPKKTARRRTEPTELEENVTVGAEDDELSPQALKPTKKRSRPATAPVQVREDTTQGAASGNELSPQQQHERLKKRGRPPLSKTTANIPRAKPTSKRTDHTPAAPPRKKQKTTKETSGATIPITVYRRTNPQQIDDDPLGADPTPSLNPADVLAQISIELTNTYIETYTTSQSSSQSSRKTRQRQINALVSFREHLQDSLFDVTVAQNTTYILATRVRKAQKEKRRLREELIARRKEREEVELEIDRIQAARKAKEEMETRQKELMQSLFDIQDAVKKGREKAKREGREGEGVVLGVEMMAQSVFEGIGRGGILQQVRDWNGMLEETAIAIEGRT